MPLKVNFTISNKIVCVFVAVAAVCFLAVGVYAALGGIPNPGHALNTIQGYFVGDASLDVTMGKLQQRVTDNCAAGSAIRTITSDGIIGCEIPLKGDTGPIGLQGLNGDIGVTGAKGPVGDAGPVGAKGATGATGAAGAKGATGAVGAKGATGATGPQGDPGAGIAFSITRVSCNTPTGASCVLSCPAGSFGITNINGNCATYSYFYSGTGAQCIPSSGFSSCSCSGDCLK